MTIASIGTSAMASGASLPELTVAAAASTVPAVSLGSTGSTRTTAPASPPSSVDVAARRQAVDAFAQAFRGSPEALVTLVSMHVREATQSQHASEVRANANEHENAIRDQEAQVQKAVEAAQKALSDAHDGDFWSTFAKVVTVVTSIAVTVCTAGAAAPAAAGALLVAFSDDITHELVRSGVLSEHEGEAFSTGLKLAGAVLMAPATGGLSVVAEGLEVVSGAVGQLLEEAGVSSDVASGIAIGLSIAASLVGVAGAAAAPDKVANTVQRTIATTSQIATGAARAVQGGFQIDGAIASHDHDIADADARSARTRGAMTLTESGQIADQLRSDMKQVGRMLRLALQAADARAHASHAAAGGRA